MRHTLVDRLGTILALVGMLAAGVGCSAGDTEMAFCDAVNRNDAAAAKAIFDAGQVDLMARDFSGKCQPGALLLHAARPQSPVFTQMAVAFVKREGVANTCWTGGKGNSIGGCAISFAALNANVEVMRALVDAGVNVTNQTARGAVDDAASQGSLEIVRMLVEKGANPASGMASAIAWRHTAVVEYLESKGVIEEVARYDDEVGALRLERHEQYRQQIASSIRQLQQRGLADPGLDPDIAASAVGALSHRFAELWLVQGGVECSIEEGADQVARLMANALGLAPSTG